jgi:2-octaprenyl-3-methyl-6-methoxy-1,4-benzoquinol hydroxylase/2-octaprenylphenol hydroxylase
MDEFDIAIVGGGMVGQSFALSVLQQSKLSVAIIEPNSPKSELNEEFHTGSIFS